MNKKKLDRIMKHPAYAYAEGVVNGDIISNNFVKIQCQQFIDELHNDDSKYWFDVQLLDRVEAMTGFIVMASGVSQGATAKSSLAGFQWFFIVNALCWKMADNHEKRRYEKSVLLIGRKSGKTFVAAIIFILLLLLEPNYSNFFSVAPDLELSSLLLQELQRLIEVSPILAPKFKINKADITCLINHNTFKPLATSNNRMDGKTKSSAVFAW